MGEQKVMCASLALAELEQAKVAGRALLREQFGKLFEAALERRREALAGGEVLLPDAINLEVPTRDMAEVAAEVLEAAGWRCYIKRQNGKPVHDIGVYVNETLEQFNERQRVSEVSDPKPGALKFGTLVRLKHDPKRTRPDGVEVGEIGVVTGSDAWECGTGSSNYVSFPAKKKGSYDSVAPRNELLLTYPAQLEVVAGSYALGEPEVRIEVSSATIEGSDPRALRAVAEASLSDGREPWVSPKCGCRGM